MFRQKLCLSFFILIVLLPVQLAYSGIAIIDANAVYPEGPLWRAGKLLYVEYAGPGVKIWDGKGITMYWAKDHCGADGLIAFGRNNLLVACYDANEIVELDENGHAIRSFTADTEGRSFIGPNDFTADGHGGVYFSASGVYDLKAPI